MSITLVLTVLAALSATSLIQRPSLARPAAFPRAAGSPVAATLKRITAADGVTDDRFGTSVAIGGNTLVVGARGDDVGANVEQGSAYVFERDAGGQRPQPDLAPTATGVRTRPSPTTPGAGEAWKVWRAAVDPTAVYALAADGDVLWAGTSFGVWRIDPKTGAYTRNEDIGITFRLLPAENRSVWAIGSSVAVYDPARETQP